MKDTWKPSWAIRVRKPTFIGGPPFLPFGSKNKYLWGNMPAIDVLLLEANEGTQYERDLQLLFAGMFRFS